jgi:lysophospholipase L1-like esterase
MALPRFYTVLLLILLTFFSWHCHKSDPPATTTGSGTGTSADTALFTSPVTYTGVCIGNSIIEGFPWHVSGLYLGDITIADTAGQPAYLLTQLTGFQWFDRGWAGQTTDQIRARFLRDAVGDSSDPGDGRGPVTLSQKPNYVVMEGGVNDIKADVPMDTIEANLAWMASTLKQNNIRCIVLNCIGEGNGAFTQTQTDQVAALNAWLASGVLDSVDATIVDINSLWNSGVYGGVSSYGNDNIHYSSLVWSGDGIHFTPAGYNAMTLATFQAAKLAMTAKFVR